MAHDEGVLHFLVDLIMTKLCRIMDQNRDWLTKQVKRTSTGPAQAIWKKRVQILPFPHPRFKIPGESFHLLKPQFPLLEYWEGDLIFLNLRVLRGLQ